MSKASPSIPSFFIPNIIKIKSMFLQYYNFAILVYIYTIFSLCNHMPQFKNTVRPVFLLSHVGKLLLKISITDIYAYSVFFESLRYKVLIFCLCRLFGGNSLFGINSFSV